MGPRCQTADVDRQLDRAPTTVGDFGSSNGGSPRLKFAERASRLQERLRSQFPRSRCYGLPPRVRLGVEGHQSLPYQPRGCKPCGWQAINGRTPPRWSACRRRWARRGSDRLAACHRLTPGLSGRYLSFIGEREEIALPGHHPGTDRHFVVAVAHRRRRRHRGPRNAGVREIARRVGGHPSTVSPQFRRDAATRGGKLPCRASVAQWKADLVAQRSETAKLVVNGRPRG